MDEIYRSQFRLPHPLYEKLKASADANHRSVNAELVARLEASFDPNAFVDLAANLQPDETSDPTIRQEVSDIKKQFSLFQEMLEILREPPTEEQIAWAKAKMAERLQEPASVPPKKSGPRPLGVDQDVWVERQTKPKKN
ncbi:Arc family DNA-binding protein [Pseudomonas sp. LMG 31766]|uniref:Arc family DNA-binding protein n=1 Tax=Pseudomonas chaetocerotis TaxID=2758695 RepID=A0A931D5D2_9PSED|nr:Arc family DNA-binding protein [Pseudomonas chaetocerotis]MBZ9665741.1 Arc family DNA-binding protein [Pseudomonas chaetocerotis]